MNRQKIAQSLGQGRKAGAGGFAGILSLPIFNIIMSLVTQFVPVEIIGSVEDIVYYVVSAGLPLAAVYFTPNSQPPPASDKPPEPTPTQ